ncbi:flagellar hook-length control protein FliK [Sulfurimonas sp.]|uniref:flagellar hook-length control protein FliK n=1 Tax=Sulfurimonas sp. TaxID=2022749 RepID=UPI00260485D7|nr:flagellar hook-length control protein FliK [Sulfurimonas sp.]
MVLVNTKQESSSVSSPLSIAPQEEKETTLSFSALLKGINTKQEDEKVIQNGSLVLSLNDDTISTKKEVPSSLASPVKNESIDVKDELALELNPKITQNITPSELKVVVQEAKQYIKSKIINSEALNKQEIQSLPKTLKGLIQVAQKIGLDISKITLEEVQNQSKTSQIPALKVKKQIQIPSISENKVQDKSPSKLEAKKETLTQLNEEVDVKVDVKKSVKVEPKVEMSKRSRVESNAKDVEKDVKTEVKTVSKTEVKTDVKPEQKSQTEQKITTPLFKAQSKTEITTQEIVNVKAMHIEPQVLKQNSKNTLELLLRGDKVAKQDTNLTADFSVATSRVIAPSAKTEVTKNLESLLQNSETQENQTQSKTDGLNVVKADSFEVKLNEAKQMVKYLSTDVKNAIEDYKSPFTRIKVQLNPQKLGEVDVTIVQRGKNLHVNLSSNNAAINTLALNANDLKVQLNNNGINNATLNFSNNAQSQDGSASQQQNQQHRQEAQENYNYFENEENSEEIISSLEIIVPNYA